MNQTVIGTGFAPAVTIVGVRVYAAYGTVPHALVLVTLGLDGTELAREKLPGGFDQSYPRFDGHWLTYRQDEDSKLDITFGSQIRNYVLAPYQLVKDLRSKLALGNPDRVLDGDLEPLMHSFLVWRKTGKVAGDDKDDAGE